MSFCSEAMNPARSLDESCLKGNKHKTFQTDYPRIRLFQTSQHQSITPSHHHTITPSHHQIIKSSKDSSLPKSSLRMTKQEGLLGLKIIFFITISFTVSLQANYSLCYLKTYHYLKRFYRE